MLNIKTLKEEIQQHLATLNQERATFERVLTALGSIGNGTRTVLLSRRKGHMSEATRRKISLAMKRSHAEKKAKG